MKVTPMPLLDADMLSEELREFAYTVSHDLNTPLRAIVEFSRLIHDEAADKLDEEHKLYLSLIIKSGEKMQQMLAGLLDYSRLNTMAKPLVKVDTGSILDQCVTVLEKKIKSGKARLEIGELPAIEVDTDQFMQLFGILIDNALTFQPAGNAPRIQVSAQKGAHEWIFSVRDNGIGIDPEFQQQIFQPFQRLHKDTEYPGIGMGLTLAKKIVGRHSGRIWVESAPRQGATFHFTIPCKD